MEIGAHKADTFLLLGCIDIIYLIIDLRLNIYFKTSKTTSKYRHQQGIVRNLTSSG
jgi:hypothetical protein